MITVSTLPRPELILMWVGKVAPPMPTTPAFWSTFTSSSAPRSAPRSGGLQSWQGVSLKSFSMTTLITGTPLKCILGSTAATVPDTLAWTAADTAAVASPTFCPTVTWSPTATQGWQGAPMCMDMGTTTRAGGGSFSIGFLFVASFLSRGWMPPKKACAISFTSSFLPRADSLTARKFTSYMILPSSSTVQQNFKFYDFFYKKSGKFMQCSLNI